MQLKHRKRHRLMWLVIAPLIVIAILVSTRYRPEFPNEPATQQSQP